MQTSTIKPAPKEFPYTTVTQQRHNVRTQKRADKTVWACESGLEEVCRVGLKRERLGSFVCVGMPAISTVNTQGGGLN